MAFGQPSGPPATARQLQTLSTLVEAAGHTSFRDARGPLGLTQRQAAGRFTRDEAETFIERLEREAEGGGGSHEVGAAQGAVPSPARTGAAATGSTSLAQQLRRVPEDLLVGELRRRGWTVTGP